LRVGGGRARVVEGGVDRSARRVVDLAVFDVAVPQVVVEVTRVGFRAAEVDTIRVVAPVFVIARHVSYLSGRGQPPVIIPALAVVGGGDEGRAAVDRAESGEDRAAHVPGVRVGDEVRAGAGPRTAERAPVEPLLSRPVRAIEDAEAGEAIGPMTRPQRNV